jgi:MFS family permease
MAQTARFNMYIVLYCLAALVLAVIGGTLLGVGCWRWRMSGRDYVMVPITLMISGGLCLLILVFVVLLILEIRLIKSKSKVRPEALEEDIESNKVNQQPPQAIEHAPTSCMDTCRTVFVISFNIFIVLAGLILLGVGIWKKVEEEAHGEQIERGNRWAMYPIVGGSVLIIMTICYFIYRYCRTNGSTIAVEAVAS